MHQYSHVGHRKRLRDRYLKCGADAMHDYELLELLLTYAIPRKDVKPVAKALLAEFGSFSAIFNAPVEQLCQVDQISANSAALLKVIKDLCTTYVAETLPLKECLKSPTEVVNFARLKIGSCANEVLMVFYLDTSNHLLDWNILSEGTLNHLTIYPRRIVEEALNQKANAIILVHNHPSNSCEPSEEDKRMTGDIYCALDTLGMKLLDHLIIGQDNYFSFIENGLL